MAENKETDASEKPDYGKALLAYSCVSIIITMLRCPELIGYLGQFLVVAAVVFFIYVVFIRMFIIHGRKH